MANCVLSGVSQMLPVLTEAENAENPSVMNKKKEKRVVFIMS